MREKKEWNEDGALLIGLQQVPPAFCWTADEPREVSERGRVGSLQWILLVIENGVLNYRTFFSWDTILMTNLLDARHQNALRNSTTHPLSSMHQHDQTRISCDAWNHRLTKVGRALQGHPVQPSTYHQYIPTKPYPSVPHLNVSWTHSQDTLPPCTRNGSHGNCALQPYFHIKIILMFYRNPDISGKKHPRFPARSHYRPQVFKSLEINVDKDLSGRLHRNTSALSGDNQVTSSTSPLIVCLHCFISYFSTVRNLNIFTHSLHLSLFRFSLLFSFKECTLQERVFLEIAEELEDRCSHAIGHH